MLLSIIIPTKNRYNTVLYAINSALNIISQDFEIVVQDCSENNNLFTLINNTYNNDERIKYYYSNDSPSLTENWNRAIGNTNGKYLCGIGDDDAILKNIIDVTNWMNINDIDTLLASFILYIWPDAYKNSYLNSKISYNKFYTGKFKKINLNYYYKNKATNCGFGYTDNLPNLYHGIVKKSLFEKHKVITGKYLDSTSFDVYNAFIISKYTKNFVLLDYPITIRGISGNSNANRIVLNRSKEHFIEFKNIKIPDIFPYELNSEISIAESTYIALFDTGQFELIKNLNIAIVYGKISANNLISSLKYFLKYVSLNKSKISFFIYFSFFLKKRILDYCKNLMSKSLNKLLPFVLNKISNKRQIKCINIELAISDINDYLFNKNINIDFDNLYNEKKEMKEIWDFLN